MAVQDLGLVPVLSLFHAVVVPSGLSTRVQPQRWMTHLGWLVMGVWLFIDNQMRSAGRADQKRGFRAGAVAHRYGSW